MDSYAGSGCDELNLAAGDGQDAGVHGCCVAVSVRLPRPVGADQDEAVASVGREVVALLRCGRLRMRRWRCCATPRQEGQGRADRKGEARSR